MRLTCFPVFALLFFFLSGFASPCFGQLGFAFDVKKPKPFEERVLRSEKTDQLKFNKPRHFFQNTFTHYNYFFNANNKLNEVLEQSKLAHIDDYSRLLTFYDYTLDETAQFKIELDSLVYKSKTAIILHDLRNDWVDNMYLIWGAAYYLRKDFDSAFLTFQFINYAFAPKEKDGYYKYIGSKLDGNTVTNIATKEKNSLSRRMFTEPPSRNDAFIWQVRTLLAMDKFAEASSLIASLKNDPLFPGRLQNDLQEVQALYFYKQDMWDSAAIHLIEALGNADTKKEKARWEYLIGQLYEKSNRFAEAQTFYTRVVAHTTDPVMEIYARLSSIRVNKEGGENYIDKNIAELLKMARKDRYVDYRDLIYFTAAQMELERHDDNAAEKYLLKSVSYHPGDMAQRNKAFIQLEQLAFSKRKYRQAFNYYDSLEMSDPGIPDPDKIRQEKEILAKVAFNIETIEYQDSLQRLAGMAEEERVQFVKKLTRKLRKSQGLKDENYTPQQGLSSSFQTTAPPDLFGNNQGKGDWYFYNQALRTRGSGEFKAKWGNRPNSDNWRRSNAIGNPALQQSQAGKTQGAGNNAATPGGNSGETTYDALYGNIPLTTEKLTTSNDSIENALATLTQLYAEELEDCASCIETSQELQRRFPANEKMDEVLFHLYYCYTKSGETSKAAELKNRLIKEFPKSKFATIARTGKDATLKKEDESATKIYESIYDKFIEGNFDEALEKKKIADSLYGSGYWTSQLLYIEGVYHAKQREDSAAKNVLSQIVARDPTSALAKKAGNLIEVLNRRSSIEEELTNLVLEKPMTREEPPVVEEKMPLAKKDTAAVAGNQVTQRPKIENKTVVKKSVTDSIAIKVAPPPLAHFDYNPDDKHYVVVILEKVDNVFRNEAKNAFGIFNREKYYSRTFDYTTMDIDAIHKLLLIGTFDSARAAIEYIQQAKPVASTRIIPWLKPEKYSFSIISNRNLELLRTNLKLDEYRKFADTYWQGKF